MDWFSLPSSNSLYMVDLTFKTWLSDSKSCAFKIIQKSLLLFHLWKFPFLPYIVYFLLWIAGLFPLHIFVEGYSICKMSWHHKNTTPFFLFSCFVNYSGHQGMWTVAGMLPEPGKLFSHQSLREHLSLLDLFYPLCPFLSSVFLELLSFVSLNIRTQDDYVKM